MESILLEDNPHWVNPTSYDGYTSREQLESALRYLSAKEVVAIVGARRVGKSSLARLMIKELLTRVSPKNIFFINLEKPAFIPYKNDPSYLETIYEAYLKLAQPNMEEKIYVFLDEVQIFTNWEVFVKSRYENSTIKFIVTGSNSSLLTSTYATVLTGRVLKLSLTSFNFREFLAYKEIDVSNRLAITRNKITIKRAVDEYLRWGGYYSVFSNDDEILKKELLKNIAEDIILKDIVPRFSVKNSAAIRDLFYYIASNAATTLNYASLAKKLSMDPKTVKEYVDYFEDNFLIRRIPKYHTKLTAQINSAKKVYMSDNGFLNLGMSSERNMGSTLENAVCNHWSSEDVTYLLENKECDFYVRDQLYQVSYTIQDEKTRKREIDALEYYMKEFAVNESVLVTYDTNETIIVENKTIKVQSIESFFLD
ncbi:MAG: ATPase [Sulfuricurvum sp. GWF2_44_89]|uniref:ATP-binding protein n=1 Tax=unclassified Sulfuricurvum TaxID=2632390 RepID=UPI0008C1CEDE|nr:MULTISPECIES: ATP-binding protein [unclassified Sulfuricurvum]OHD77429.1 MAG: ATPase [Sulfuricurvum sp. GWF2_44_89]OHD91212.1 MAG: ATPase [Sulfuricurvum sp. RIFOXYD2_FULL_44_160]OHD93220.1 MAG: ATPase [Sulfuricurvum sp. RIFOXYD12_FULL_44_77]